MIPIYEPYLGGEEEEMVLACLRSGWISSAGEYVRLLENEFAAKCGSKHAVAVANGTIALHLILHALGIGPGDEVLVPTLTFIATANAVHYTGATPIFVDSESDTWNMSAEDAETRITTRTRAIIPVHLYGHPCRMSEILSLAHRYNLIVIEDAAEAHFARIGNECVGTFGIASAFSFYGNKIMTTGEGGIITTNSTELAARLRYLRDHAMSPTRRYWHDEIGFNYRMTNLQAALGVAQLRKVDHILQQKLMIARYYRQELADIATIELPPSLPGFTNVYWLFSILLATTCPLQRAELMSRLEEKGITTRPFFFPLHTLPPYCNANGDYLIATSIASRGLCLPSGPTLSWDTIKYIAESIKNYIL